MALCTKIKFSACTTVRILSFSPPPPQNFQISIHSNGFSCIKYLLKAGKTCNEFARPMTYCRRYKLIFGKTRVCTGKVEAACFTFNFPARKCFTFVYPRLKVGGCIFPFLKPVTRRYRRAVLRCFTLLFDIQSPYSSSMVSRIAAFTFYPSPSSLSRFLSPPALLGRREIWKQFLNCHIQLLTCSNWYIA